MINTRTIEAQSKPTSIFLANLILYMYICKIRNFLILHVLQIRRSSNTPGHADGQARYDNLSARLGV